MLAYITITISPQPSLTIDGDKMASQAARSTVEELLELDGVVAAGEFGSDGSVVEYTANMEMSEELAGMTGQFCATITMLFDTLAGAFTQLSGMDWTPQHGWMYAGGDYTVAVGGNTGVFVETEHADFNQLYEALVATQ